MNERNERLSEIWNAVYMGVCWFPAGFFGAVLAGFEGLPAALAGAAFSILTVGLSGLFPRR